MFSSSLYAGWTKASETVDGDIHYVDFERIRKVDGYVYWWDLTDFLESVEGGYLSSKTYKQGDCKLFRVKSLSYSFHKEPMGGGTGGSYNPENPEWVYPHPNSTHEIVLKFLCNR
jgi:hypothetical protein